MKARIKWSSDLEPLIDEDGFAVSSELQKFLQECGLRAIRARQKKFSKRRVAKKNKFVVRKDLFGAITINGKSIPEEKYNILRAMLRAQ